MLLQRLRDVIKHRESNKETSVGKNETEEQTSRESIGTICFLKQQVSAHRRLHFYSLQFLPQALFHQRSLGDAAEERSEMTIREILIPHLRFFHTPLLTAG